VTSSRKSSGSRGTRRESRKRGGRSSAGKTASNSNALRHGVAAINRRHPKYSAEIERRAEEYCNGDNDPLLMEQARIAAENDLILAHVRAARIASIERLRDPDAFPYTDVKGSFARARAKIREAKLIYEQLVEAKAKAADAKDGAGGDGKPGPPSNSAGKEATSNGATGTQSPTIRPSEPRALRDECEAIALALPELKRLERYDRRAWSRRTRAMERFLAIKCLSDFEASRSNDGGPGVHRTADDLDRSSDYSGERQHGRSAMSRGGIPIFGLIGCIRFLRLLRPGVSARFRRCPIGLPAHAPTCPRPSAWRAGAFGYRWPAALRWY
jgi:hypothetical protein